MQLLLKDKPILDIQENGVCTILDFDHLPFALRKESITLLDFVEWASIVHCLLGAAMQKKF